MVEISRDGTRVYWTNSLYSTWDNQFYPDGVPGAEVMAIANPGGGLELAKDYWVELPGRVPRAPDPARRRRLLDGFVLLSIGLNGSGVDWTVAGALARGHRERPLPRGESRMGWPLAVSAGMMEKSPRGACGGALRRSRPVICSRCCS